MVGDMENYKVLVSSESESKEVQDLLFELGGDFCFGGKLHCNTHLGLVTINKNGLMANIELEGFDYKEITINQLRDMVVLKRNSIDDAILKDTFGDIWYVDSTNNYWMFENGTWREAEEPLFKIEPIKKLVDKEVKMKEYLELQDDGIYDIVLAYRKEGNNWIEVPEGAEILLLDGSCGEDVLYFVKHDGEVFHEYYIADTRVPLNTWIKGTIKVLHEGMGKVLWQRNPETTNTPIQDKLKFIEKWLNGEKIQYILGDISEKSQSEKTQWHNFTEGAMQYIKRSDIKFREAPKYVTINGVEFKSVEILLKYVKNNFDLENGV